MDETTTMPGGGATRAAISVHTRGFGFATAVDNSFSKGAFVAPPDLSPFLAGDVVDCDIVVGSDGRTSATGLALVRRWRTELLGRVVVERGRTSLKVDPQVSNRTWPLAELPAALGRDSWVIGRLEGNSLVFDREVPDAQIDVTAALVRWGLRDGYPPEVLAAPREPDAHAGRRRDLRDTPTVTIDAPHSRDLDDALAVLPPQADGSLRVLVMIADVDSAVPVGSVVDAEARRRMTSVYLPDRVLPMLPHGLSEDALSLLPGKERRTLTCELRIDPQGEVTSCDLSISLIRSTARLSYAAVSAYLDQGDPSGIPEDVRETVRWLRTAAARISAARAARGGISLERDEVYLSVDKATGEPTNVEVRQLNSAHRLVERIMVATNEAVARWLVARGLPALFRVQDEPEPDRVADLASFARNFGFETAFGARLTPRVLAAFEEQFGSSAVAPQVRTVLRRVLGRARYTVEPAPHFGLAAPLYLHFTSPIRRYPDLLVHRIIKAHLEGRRDQRAGDPDIELVGRDMNEMALRARRAETDRRRTLTARLFADRLGHTFDARIVGMKPFGMVVQLDGAGVTGMVMTSDLAGGPYTYDHNTETLSGPERTFMVGVAVRVEVTGTDERLGRIELALFED